MDTSNVQEDGWEEQLIDYSLGVMEPGEAAKFELDLAECRRHVRFAARYEQAVALIGMSAAPAEPPQGHKTRLMARLAATPQEEAAAPATPQAPTDPEAGRPSLSVVPPPAPGTTAAPVVSLDKHRERRRNTLLGAIGAVAAAIILVVGLWALLGDRVVIPADYQIVTLAPQPGNEGVNIVALYHPDRPEAILLADGMPTLPAGKVFEFWVLPAGGAGPLPNGVFSAESTGDARYETRIPDDASNYAGFAVSIEDAPGVDVPTNVIAAGTFTTP